ncbi:TetR/AcrR family transcriptional regulator [Oceanospirillum sediminis]|uniref:TetR/AcrR family transcriptional regulator n=1 Tax=Oceanospirillum sediminis TaxID=2760088 RepID=A0A839IT93_9GAMM|nr:TetR/AcrR family transcriptional regulator [Oceanospirillum sediminis]MBB1488525.1 TetR/AcrR family transcriptional regulator [Oceanospirillum sediminis]
MSTSVKKDIASNNFVQSNLSTTRTKVTQSDNRQVIIDTARELFACHGYQNVSIRGIARSASVDPGLIRYYFGCKEQLFIAVLNETLRPVREKILYLKDSTDLTTPERFLRTHYQLMARYPNWPRLMYSLSNMPDDQITPDLQAFFDDLFRPQELLFFEMMKKQGLLRDDVNTDCARLSFFSLMIFPFIAPLRLKQKLNIQLTPEFLDTLAEQNGQLLRFGLMDISSATASANDTPATASAHKVHQND